MQLWKRCNSLQKVWWHCIVDNLACIQRNVLYFDLIVIETDIMQFNSSSRNFKLSCATSALVGNFACIVLYDLIVTMHSLHHTALLSPRRTAVTRRVAPTAGKHLGRRGGRGHLCHL